MQEIVQIDRNLISHMKRKQARIICERRGSCQYIAVPNGDRRRRPVAWITESTLKRLLGIGVLIHSGNEYILA